MTQTCTLPGRPEAAKSAREFTAKCLPGCPSVYEAMLCVNELVVNAIQHSRSGLPGGTIEVRIAVVAGEWLRVEVQDAGPLAPAVPAQRGPLDERGRGLALVVSLAEVFGADGGLRWFWMPWAPGVREVWDRQTFAEVIRAAEAAGWAPDSGASRTAPPCEVRARGLHPAGGVS